MAIRDIFGGASDSFNKIKQRLATGSKADYGIEFQGKDNSSVENTVEESSGQNASTPVADAIPVLEHEAPSINSSTENTQQPHNPARFDPFYIASDRIRSQLKERGYESNVTPTVQKTRASISDDTGIDLSAFDEAIPTSQAAAAQAVTYALDGAPTVPITTIDPNSPEYTTTRTDADNMQAGFNIDPDFVPAKRTDKTSVKVRKKSKKYNRRRNNPDNKPFVNTTNTKGDEDNYEKIMDFIFNFRRERKKNAKRHNARELQRYNAWRQTHMNSDPSEFNWQLTSEDFADADIRKKELFGEGQSFDNDGGTSSWNNQRFKPNKKQTKLIKRTIVEIEAGFLPVMGMYIEVDEETGEARPRFGSNSDRSFEDAIIGFCDNMFGSHTVDDLQNMCRLIRCAASITYDRQGRMFGESFDENKGRWYISEKEMIGIMRNIESVMKEKGIPLAIAFDALGNPPKLRGTDAIPCGILPRQVAEAMWRPGAPLYEKHLEEISAGVPVDERTVPYNSAQDIIDACKDEWYSTTMPYIEENLREIAVSRFDTDTNGMVKNVNAQRIVLYDFMISLAISQGISDTDLIENYFWNEQQIAQNLRIAEFKDVNATYAQALDNSYDNDRVTEELQRKSEDANKALDKFHGKKVGRLGAACNLWTAWVRFNALFLQIPIMVPAIIEKGVGNIMTRIALNASMRNYEMGEDYDYVELIEEIKPMFETRDAHEAIDALVTLLEIGGPEALYLFSQTKKAPTYANVKQFLTENVLPQYKNDASKIKQFNEKMSRLNRAIITGSTAFKKSQTINFMYAFLLFNKARQSAHAQMDANGQIDTRGGASYSVDEILGAANAANGDVYRFIGDLMQYGDATVSALITMNTNNIGQFNPISHKVGKILRQHGIANAMIVAYVDKFVTYGLNFIVTMIPFSRTFTYLATKGITYKGTGSSFATSFAIGGNIADATVDSENFDGEIASAFSDPGFIEGLKMNLIFDSVVLGRWGMTAALLGAVFAVLGFDPPDDDDNMDGIPDDILNWSMWRIGSNVGWGPDGKGIEIGVGWFTNDLTQLGLPGAVALGAAASGHGEYSFDLFMDSLYDQFEGSCVLDVIDNIKDGTHYFEEMNKAAADPTYKPDIALGGWQSMAQYLIYNPFNATVPLDPLYKNLQYNTLFRGRDALAHTTNFVFDDSSDWAIENGILKEVDNDWDKLYRKNSAQNLLLAAIGDLTRDDANTTGYFWWEMPYRKSGDELAIALRQEYEILDTPPDGMTQAEYNLEKSLDTLEILDKYKNDFGDNTDAWIANGLWIPEKNRRLALDYCFSEINALDNWFFAMSQSGAWDYATCQSYNLKIKNKKSQLYDYVAVLKSNKIPAYMQGYVQEQTDYDVSYINKETGKPATVLDYYMGRAVSSYNLKGNHSSGWMPITVVDSSSNDKVIRTHNFETQNVWMNDLTDPLKVRDAYGDIEYKEGKNKGKTVNEVIFQDHPTQPTKDRAWEYEHYEIPKDIANFGLENATGGVHGSLGQYSQVANGNNLSNSDTEDGLTFSDVNSLVGDIKDLIGTGSGLTTPASEAGALTAPLSSGGKGGDAGIAQILAQYGLTLTDVSGGGTKWNLKNSGGGYGYSSRSSYGLGGTSSYSPKIYSNTHTLYSNKPNTSYVQKPYNAKTSTYLRPGVSTKGSREAYKRQDI